MVPFSFTVRALPLGQSNPFQPYIGVGLNVVNWRYSESGDFIDFNNNREIFRESFVASGTATGPVVLAGIRFGGESLTAGGEIRYSAANADVSSDFAGSRIDLGGWTYNFTMGFRFGR
jgi:outer membrane protein W